MSGCFADDELDVVGTLGVTVDGHGGGLAFLRAPHPLRVLLSLGRRHLYEGISVAEAQETVRAAAAAGARHLVLTNAAGGLHPGLRVGDVMLITEMITSLVGARLRGSTIGYPYPIPERSGSMLRMATDLYPAIEDAALDRGVQLRSGVYVGLSGPCYETRAEVRMLRKLGADAVGMSTIVEAAAAAELGLGIVGLSLITNVQSESPADLLDHSHVVQQGLAGGARVRRGVDAALAILSR